MTGVAVSNQQQMLTRAAQTGQPLYFEAFEKNPGVIELRSILRETKPNTSARMHRSQMAMPYIKQMWVGMSSGIQGMALPRPIKAGMNRMFERLKNDKQYALFCYNNWPVIADRYGYGKQVSGKPRLSFALMNRDPLCRELMK